MADAELVIAKVSEALRPWTRGGSEPFSMGLAKGASCRWLLPANGRRARKVLANWRPYGISSTVKWLAARTLVQVPGTSGLFPGLNKHPPLPVLDAKAFGLDSLDGALYPVIYVGTPGPQRKAVCTLVDGDGRSHAILKLPLEPGAEPALVREADNLQRLAETLPALAIPRALPGSSDRPAFLQTVLEGRPSARRFGAAHARFLLSLRGDGDIALEDVAAGLPASKQPRPAADQWLADLRGAVPRVWTHGDFAPWNLFVRPDGELAVFDWEEGQPDGFPVWDIAHFHVQQTFLFQESASPLALMQANPAYPDYLRALGLSREDGVKLFLLYCLAMARQAEANGEHERSQFLFEQFSSETGAR